MRRVCLLAYAISVAVQNAAANSPKAKRLQKSVVESCKFTIDDRHYNLCPLFRDTKKSEWDVSLEYSTPPTETTVTYQIGLDGPLSPWFLG